MKKVTHCTVCLLALLTAQVQLRADNLSQTFELGEDTSAWNSSWNNVTVESGFLDTAVGGAFAGSGNSSAQTFSRSFASNLAGISLSQPYYIGLYLQVDTTALPASGQFDVIDGAYGASAADLHVGFQNSQLIWQAKSNGGFVDLGLNAYLGTPYWVMLAIDPAAGRYAVTVESVDTAGNVLASASAENLISDANVFGNHQNGNLLFYLQASAGNAAARIDNILISAMPISTTPTPEPSGLALLAGGAAGIFGLRRLRSVA